MLAQLAIDRAQFADPGAVRGRERVPVDRGVEARVGVEADESLDVLLGRRLVVPRQLLLDGLADLVREALRGAGDGGGAEGLLDGGMGRLRQAEGGLAGPACGVGDAG